MLHKHGLNVVGPDQDDPYGLPRTVTIETMENEQYLYASYTLISLSAQHDVRIFCVAQTTAFNIVTRLDRLMVATKELVGEQYHIAGMHIRGFGNASHGVPLGSRTTTKDA